MTQRSRWAKCPCCHMDREVTDPRGQSVIRSHRRSRPLWKQEVSMRSLVTRKVRLATRVGADVDRRLRMFALARRLCLSDALTVLLDGALPPADELAASLRESEAACGGAR